MKASLGILGDALGRKVAILGDMGELGADEKELHGEVGTFAGTCGIDLLICVGPLCREMEKKAKEAAKKAKNPLEVVHLDTLEEVLENLPELLFASTCHIRCNGNRTLAIYTASGFGNDE